MDKLLSIKNVFYFFKVMGIASIEMKVKIEHGISKLTFSKSKMGILYNICLICFIGLSFSISFTYIFEEKPLTDRSFSEKIKNMDHALSIISAIYVLGIFSLRQQSAIKIVQGIYDHEKLLSIRINKIQPTLMSIVFVLIIDIFIIIAAHIIFWKEIPAMNVYLMSIHISLCIINSVFMQYSMILELMNQFFKSINQDLGELSEHMSGDPSFMSQRTNRKLLLKIDKIFESYKSLVRLAREISDFYSEPMLICMPCIFVGLIFSSYASAAFESHDIITIIVLGFRAVFIYSIPFIMLFTSAENTVSESKKTVRLVYKCLMSMGDWQVEAEKKLYRFADYLRHQKIRFGVYDLITLDESLLMPIIGTVATYVMALHQFPTGVYSYNN